MRLKKRRHHNTDGRRQIQRGKTREQVKRMARLLGISLHKRREDRHDD